MAKVLLFLFILLPIPGFAQLSIYKTWIGEKQEYLELNKKDISKIDAQYDYYSNDDFKVTANDNIVDIIRIPRDYQKREEPHNYHFSVKKLTADTLILTGLDSPSMSVFYYKPEYLFVNRSTLINKDLTFQKLEFTSDICMGHCPQMMVAIDATGKMHFRGGMDTKMKNKRLYVAQLSTKQMGKLVQILKESCLDKLPEELPLALDAPQYNFVIYYNNKKLKSWGCDVPYASEALKQYLMSLYLKVALKETNDGFKWETNSYMDVD